MAGFRTPGPLCVTTAPAIDTGTLHLGCSPCPGVLGRGPREHDSHKKSVPSHRHSRTSHSLEQIHQEVLAIRKHVRTAGRHVKNHRDATKLIRNNVARGKPRHCINLPGQARRASPAQPAPQAAVENPVADLRDIPPEKIEPEDDMKEQGETFLKRAAEVSEWMGEFWEKYKNPIDAAREFIIEKGFIAEKWRHGMEVLDGLKDLKLEQWALRASASVRAERAEFLLQSIRKDLKAFDVAEDLSSSFKWHLALDPEPAFQRLRATRAFMKRIESELVFEKIGQSWIYTEAAKKYEEFGKAIEELGIAENHTVLKLVKLMGVTKPIIEGLDLVGQMVDRLEIVLDAVLVVVELGKNHPHQALYKFGELVFDITLFVSSASAFLIGSVDLVFLLVLFFCVFIGRIFLKWLQGLIEDPNHMSLDKKLDQLSKSGKINRALTLDQVMDQARREGRLSNPAVIWPSN